MVFEPLGFTVPFNVAAEMPIPVAIPVTTVGGDGGGGQADVVNVASDPNATPAEEFANAWK